MGQGFTHIYRLKIAGIDEFVPEPGPRPNRRDCRARPDSAPPGARPVPLLDAYKPFPSAKLGRILEHPQPRRVFTHPLTLGLTVSTVFRERWRLGGFSRLVEERYLMTSVLGPCNIHEFVRRPDRGIRRNGAGS